MAVTNAGRYLGAMLDSVSGGAGISRNIAIITGTQLGSVPFMRGLGLRREFIDAQPDIARTLAASEVYDAVSMYEPRAGIDDVSFSFGKEPGEWDIAVTVAEREA